MSNTPALADTLALIHPRKQDRPVYYSCLLQHQAKKQRLIEIKKTQTWRIPHWLLWPTKNRNKAQLGQEGSRIERNGTGGRT